MKSREDKASEKDTFVILLKHYSKGLDKVSASWKKEFSNDNLALVEIIVIKCLVNIIKYLVIMLVVTKCNNSNQSVIKQLLNIWLY
jgi:hypothetical protein